MELQTKRQIDDLIEYSLAIKDMYQKIAVWDASENPSKKEQEEINNILLIINKAIEIEGKKIEKIRVTQENYDAISDYLIKFYHDTEVDDFLYDNHLERFRVLKQLQNKFRLEALNANVPIENKNIDYGIYRAVENNYIYATNYEMNQNSDEEIFSYLKHGGIFISPFYDKTYFPKCQVHPITHYSHFRWLMQNPTEDELNKTALSFINEKYTEIVNCLYNGFTNMAMLNDYSTFIRAIHNAMLMNAYLISTLDPNFIDLSYIKFRELKKEEKEYSKVNDLIQGILVRSKKQVLAHNNKKDSK